MINNLTGIRAVAALFVLIYHSAALSNYFVPESNKYIVMLVSKGWVGVDIFLVLSGFLLTMVYINKRETFSWQSYIKKRCFRILPAYYFQLILISVAVFYFFNVINVRDIIFHLLMLHNLDLNFSGSINGVYWTLPLEFWFYFLLPLFLFNKRILLIILALIMMALVYRYISFALVSAELTNVKLWAIYQLPGVFDEFMYGVFFALLRFKYKIKLSLSVVYILLIVALMIFLLTALKTDGSVWDSHRAIVASKLFLGISIGVIIFCSTYNLPVLNLLLGNKVIVFFGEISYGIYLWHLVVFYLFLGSIYYGPALSIYFEPDFWRFKSIVFYLWPLIFFISFINYKLIELPFLKLSAVKKTVN